MVSMPSASAVRTVPQFFLVSVQHVPDHQAGTVPFDDARQVRAWRPAYGCQVQ